MTLEERSRKIEAYGAAHRQLLAALERFPRGMWQFRPAPDRWTIHEIVVHIADSEANSYIRCRRLIAEPGSAVLGYDENKWAQVLHYHDQNADEAIELFKWLRRMSHALIKTLPDTAWSNTVVHSENGVMSMDDWLDTYERHIPDHIEQMQRVTRCKACMTIGNGTRRSPTMNGVYLPGRHRRDRLAREARAQPDLTGEDRRRRARAGAERAQPGDRLRLRHGRGLVPVGQPVRHLRRRRRVERRAS